MVLLSLTLGVGSVTNAERSSSSQLKSKIDKAHKRDAFTCRFCGFQSEHFQRAITWPEAGDPPLATVCIFCEQALHLERAGITGAGILIWLPEISQADLHHLVRAIYVARAEQTKPGTAPTAALATRALDALTARRAEAKKRLGSDDPLLLATILRESLDEKEIKAALPKLDGIRLLPSEKYMMRTSKGDANQFPQIAKYWASSSGPFAAWPIETWQETLKKALAKVGNA